MAGRGSGEGRYVGVAEAAGILGVSRTRVGQLRRESRLFPEVVAEPASGPLWERSDIERFKQIKRRPGRPQGYSPKRARESAGGETAS